MRLSWYQNEGVSSKSMPASPSPSGRRNLSVLWKWRLSQHLSVQMEHCFLSSALGQEKQSALPSLGIGCEVFMGAALGPLCTFTPLVSWDASSESVGLLLDIWDSCELLVINISAAAFLRHIIVSLLYWKLQCLVFAKAVLSGIGVCRGRKARRCSYLEVWFWTKDF